MTSDVINGFFESVSSSSVFKICLTHETSFRGFYIRTELLSANIL